MNPSAWLWEDNDCRLFSVFTFGLFFFLSVVIGAYLAKLMANNGSWTSSISRCCAMMDCIFMRLLLVACCSVTVSVGDESWLHRRDCTDSRNNVYKLFLSASARKHLTLRKTQKHSSETWGAHEEPSTLTTGWSVWLFILLTIQIFEQLHGLPSHDDLLEDRFEEGHHGELPVAGALIPSGAAASCIAQFLLVLHGLRHAV